eukprot:580558-Alexandrium_andersonii.AAC.1
MGSGSPSSSNPPKTSQNRFEQFRLRSPSGGATPRPRPPDPPKSASRAHAGGAFWGSVQGGGGREPPRRGSARSCLKRAASACSALQAP